MPKNNEFAEVSRMAANSTLTHDTGNNELNEELSDLRVSQKTAKYIYILDHLGGLWCEIYKAIEEDYGSSQVDIMIERDFEKGLLAIRKQVEEYFISSIIEVHGLRGNENIL